MIHRLSTHSLSYFPRKNRRNERTIDEPCGDTRNHLPAYLLFQYIFHLFFNFRRSPQKQHEKKCNFRTDSLRQTSGPSMHSLVTLSSRLMLWKCMIFRGFSLHVKFKIRAPKLLSCCCRRLPLRRGVEGCKRTYELLILHVFLFSSCPPHRNEIRSQILLRNMKGCRLILWKMEQLFCWDKIVFVRKKSRNKKKSFWRIIPKGEQKIIKRYDNK